MKYNSILLLILGLFTSSCSTTKLVKSSGPIRSQCRSESLESDYTKS